MRKLKSDTLFHVFFRDLNLRKPDYFLEAVGNTTAETIGNVIAKADAVMEKEKPDALININKQKHT